MGKNQNQGKFGNFRGLKVDRSDIEPAVSALDVGYEAGTLEHEHSHQKQVGHDQNRDRILVKMMVVEIGDRNHDHHADHSKERLIPDEIIAVPIHVIIRIGIAGGKHHHKADRQQHKNQKEKG